MNHSINLKNVNFKENSSLFKKRTLFRKSVLLKMIIEEIMIESKNLN